MKYVIILVILLIYIGSVISIFCIIKDLIKLNNPKRKSMKHDSKVQDAYEYYTKSINAPELMKLTYNQFVSRLLSDDEFNRVWGKYITEDIHIFTRIDLYGRRGYSLKNLNYDDQEELTKALDEAEIPKRKLK